MRIDATFRRKRASISHPWGTSRFFFAKTRPRVNPTRRSSWK